MSHPTILARRILLVAAVVFSGCSSTVSPPADKPIIAVPATIEFGMVRVGQVKDTTVRISNTGTAVLEITSQSFSSAQFTLPDTTQKSLSIASGGGYQDVRIRFVPKDSGDILAYDSIRSNAGLTVVKLHAGGIARTRILELEASIDFGPTRLGLCADSTLGSPSVRSVMLRNSGNDSLQLTAVTASSADFTVLSFPAAIAAGDSGAVRMKFCPATVGLESTLLQITSNASANTATGICATGLGVPYSAGVGSVYHFSQDSLDANFQPVKVLPATRTVQATGISYAGMSGVTQMAEGGGKVSYYRIESNGDVSYWSEGLPTGDTAHPFGAGWWVLPFGSHDANVNLAPRSDTTFTNAQGTTINMHMTEAASYVKDTVMQVQGRSLTVQRVDVTVMATYNVGGTVAETIQEGLILFFSPDVGYLALQLQVVGVVAGAKTNISRGALILQGYNLR